MLHSVRGSEVQTSRSSSPTYQVIGIASTLILSLVFLYLQYRNLDSSELQSPQFLEAEAEAAAAEAGADPVGVISSTPLCVGAGVHNESAECVADLTCASNPLTHVRQWNLCSRTWAEMEADAAFDESLRHRPRPKGEIKQPQAAIIDGNNFACMRDDFVPTAHVAGISHHPRMLLTLSRKFLQQVAGFDESQIAQFPTPWEMQLLVYEARYNISESTSSATSVSGEWRMLVLWDFVQPIHRRNDHMGPAIFYWNRMIYRGALQKVMTALMRNNSSPSVFRCTFPDSGDEEFVSTPARILGDPAMIGGWELTCAHPSSTALPPARLNVELSVGEEGENWLASFESTMISPALVPICLNCKRKISAVHCGRLGNPVYHASLPEFIRHHAYLGIEGFDFLDRYGEHREVLQPFIDSGLVHYQRHREIAKFFFKGPFPTFGKRIPKRSEDAMSDVPQPMWYTQTSDLEACRFRHFHSAKFVASWDLDEYLYFPAPSATIPQFAATCLSAKDWTFRYPLVKTVTEGMSCEVANSISRENPFTSPLNSPDLEHISPAVYAAHANTSPCCRSMLSDYIVHTAITPPDPHEDQGTNRVPDLPIQKVRPKLLQIYTWSYMAPLAEYASKAKEFLTSGPWNLTEDMLDSPQAQCILNKHFAYPQMLRFPIPDQKESLSVGKQKILFGPTLPCSIFMHSTFECTNSTQDFLKQRPESPKQMFLIHFTNQASARRAHEANMEAPRGTITWYERMQGQLERKRVQELEFVHQSSPNTVENY